jgi:hypothetical protein
MMQAKTSVDWYRLSLAAIITLVLVIASAQASSPSDVEPLSTSNTGHSIELAAAVGKSVLGDRTPQTDISAPTSNLILDKPSSPLTILHDQYDAFSPTGSTSQNFEPDLDAYDSQVADNFYVPSRDTWQIAEVSVSGVFSGTGIPESVNVFVYESSGANLPSTPVFTRTNILYTAGPNRGDLIISLDPPISLGGGAYWLSVQANENFSTSGQWFWRNRMIASGTYPAAWRNPGGGFARSNCLGWGGRGGCGLSGAHPDQVFALSGTSTLSTPTPTGTRPTATSTPTPTETGPTATGTLTPSPTSILPTVTLPLPSITSLTPTQTPTPTMPLPVLTVYSTITVLTRTPTPVLCTPRWMLVGSPSPGGSQNRLNGVAAAGPDDIWAAGWYRIAGYTRTLVEHWNGSEWVIVPSPNVGGPSTDNFLSDLAVISPSDIWAVGFYIDYAAGSERHTMSLHWNGTEWSVVATPSLGASYESLADVDASSADNVWAVGEFIGAGSLLRTLTMRWNGSEWAIVPSPNPMENQSALKGITVLSASEAWAVGFHSQEGMGLSLTMRWNGANWSVVPSPNPGNFENTLNAVDALSSSDVWAVGTYRNSSAQLGLTMHWDGSVWNYVPEDGSSETELFDVTVIGPNDAWAVGTHWAPNTIKGVLTEHWNGVYWIETPAISPFGNRNYLYGVAATATDDVWAVGEYETSGPVDTVIERYTSIGSCNTPTPVVCQLQFSDVPNSNTFYPFVRCLACLGIVSGYADGTFRPNNDVTRGQLAKIVSNAASFSESPDPQIFEDVPASNTFYEWINRLARRGHMSGYPCGGVGEPCLSGMPYFRPFANATRGQTSKIVSNAAGFAELATSQTFEDVRPNHTFYQEIQRLASRSIMGGYECGRPTEPCVPPNNRPYFRPQNNVTRGQSAKIVANTFFPNCQVP